MAFPRYGVDVHADLVRDALYGRLGDLSDSVYGPGGAVRAGPAGGRRGDPGLCWTAHDVVLLDRYVDVERRLRVRPAGRPGRPTDFAEWVRALEIDRFGVPVPDRQILLATPLEVGRRAGQGPGRRTADRALDRFEADAGLQQRTGGDVPAAGRGELPVRRGRC